MLGQVILPALGSVMHTLLGMVTARISTKQAYAVPFSDDVLNCFTDLFVAHGPPEHIQSDNGPEFVAGTCGSGSAESA